MSKNKKRQFKFVILLIYKCPYWIFEMTILFDFTKQINMKMRVVGVEIFKKNALIVKRPTRRLIWYLCYWMAAILYFPLLSVLLMSVLVVVPIKYAPAVSKTLDFLGNYANFTWPVKGKYVFWSGDHFIMSNTATPLKISFGSQLIWIQQVQNYKCEKCHACGQICTI